MLVLLLTRSLLTETSELTNKLDAVPDLDSYSQLQMSLSDVSSICGLLQ
jgi:hypothetical protein